MDKITQLQHTIVCSVRWVRGTLCNAKHHARLVIRECPVRILARTSSILKGFLWFSSVPPDRWCANTSIRPLPLPTKILSIHL